jgi:hypothetical protein
MRIKTLTPANKMLKCVYVCFSEREGNINVETNISRENDRVLH